MEQLNKRMEINGISKTFYSDKGYFTAIKDVRFDVNDGEFLVILGPGRCGKTVLLNIIAGLEQQTEGKAKNRFVLRIIIGLRYNPNCFQVIISSNSSRVPHPPGKAMIPSPVSYTHLPSATGRWATPDSPASY